MTENEVSLERWNIAQNSEKEMWAQYDTKFLSDYTQKFYAKKAEVLLAEIKPYIKITKKSRFLQIGCGPADIINCIKVGEKHSIDPLAGFYKQSFKMNYKLSHLVQGKGEELPYKDKYFDVVILANVLDHTHNPDKVLSEINRVLKDNGILYFENHFYQKSFLLLAKIFGFFKRVFRGEIFNIHHPHMFPLDVLKNRISTRFTILSEIIGRDIEDNVYNLQDLKERRKTEKFTRRFPAKFGLLGVINYTSYVRNKNPVL
ncbi:methyltransferase domain-containing protein [Candidatus Pacearchaeota archaeon]|nr:methyltransferase domain-containing protein [Candidatus Pacearchaeota archaeon]